MFPSKEQPTSLASIWNKNSAFNKTSKLNKNYPTVKVRYGFNRKRLFLPTQSRYSLTSRINPTISVSKAHIKEMHPKAVDKKEHGIDGYQSVQLFFNFEKFVSKAT